MGNLLLVDFNSISLIGGAIHQLVVQIEQIFAVQIASAIRRKYNLAAIRGPNRFHICMWAKSEPRTRVFCEIDQPDISGRCRRNEPRHHRLR